MKKLIIAIACVAFSGIASAQKPVAGDVTGEVQLNFQTGTAPISIAFPEIRGRYFLQDKLALRVGLNINSSSSTKNFVDDPSAAAPKTGKLEYSSSGFGISLGIEKHMEGTTRLSPWIGAALSFNSSSSSVDGTNAGYDYTTGSELGFVDGLTQKYEPGSSSTFGIRLLAGADYYFIDNVYLGIEVGWGFASTSTGEGTNTVTSSGTTTTTKVPEASGSNISVSANPGLRLGLRF